MKSNLLRRFVAGLLIAIPIVVLGIALYTVFEVIQFIGDPLFGLIGTGTPFDSAIEHVLAGFAAGVTLYLLGYAAELQVIKDRVNRLDRLLVLLVPGYTMIKGFIGGVVHEDAMTEGFRPVLVDTVDSTRIGFEIERSDSGKVVVFLPNAPAASTGIIAAYDAERVTRLNVPPHRVMEMLSFYGAGLTDLDKLQIN
ncbi:hypothetical protein [Tropicibacter sp. Alg240-R139]|uniref:hypothetical protein n=1 Tax=Tropicibacter sp. Alg240-R139 TaxID=2305991 RepID=UPI0013DEAD02|nr:hypothetical protein [Tropicibacter sp. Alg240-R139]